MLRFRDGDPAAFDALFHRYAPRLVSFLARMVREKERAEELAQEAFMRVVLARDRYQPRARFSTWIFGIASNLALNDLARAHRSREQRGSEGAAERIADPSPLPDESLEARRKLLWLEEALAKLPARQRAALLLRADQGLSYEEIAAALETSAKSVKSLIHRARSALLGAGQEGGAS
jgi:RNA polymerase sigma-70 factor (ECF subfamily)